MNYESRACIPLEEISGHSRFLKCNTHPLAMREYRGAMQEYRVSVREYKLHMVLLHSADRSQNCCDVCIFYYISESCVIITKWQ